MACVEDNDDILRFPLILSTEPRTLALSKRRIVSRLRRAWGLPYELREWQAAVKRMSDCVESPTPKLSKIFSLAHFLRPNERSEF